MYVCISVSRYKYITAYIYTHTYHMSRGSWAKACSACLFHAEMDSRLSWAEPLEFRVIGGAGGGVGFRV